MICHGRISKPASVTSTSTTHYVSCEPRRWPWGPKFVYVPLSMHIANRSGFATKSLRDPQLCSTSNRTLNPTLARHVLRQPCQGTPSPPQTRPVRLRTDVEFLGTFESYFFLSFMSAQVRYPERLQPLSHCMKIVLWDQFPITKLCSESIQK